MKFPRILTAFLLLVSVSGCAYVIPPEQNVPRHNTVVGEPRKPQLNVKTIGPRSAIAAPVMPVARNEAPNLPPVDEATQREANKEMAIQADTAPVAALTPAANGRRVPAENAQFQLSENTYPTLSEVPPRPVTEGPGSVKDRLSNTQSELEQSRDASNISKEALARDAAAEPSLLAPLPTTNAAPVTDVPAAPQPAASTPVPPSFSVPPRETIRRAPADNKPAAVLTPAPAQTVANTAPTAVPPSANVAPVQAVAVAVPRSAMPVTTAAALPNTPTFAPPAPMRGTTGTYMPQVASTPVAAAAPQQTVALARPVASTPLIASQELAAPAASTNTAANRPTVRRGDFDPLAVADNAPIATSAPTVATYSAVQARNSSGYMATSRYADRRY